MCVSVIIPRKQWLSVSQMTRRCVKLSNDYQFNSALLFYTYQYLLLISSLAIRYKHIWNYFPIYINISFQHYPSWSRWICEDIWRIFGFDLVKNPFGSLCHQLMYTYYQFVPPWMQMIVHWHWATYGKSYKPYGGEHTSAWKSMRYCRTRSWIIPAL